MKLMSANRLSDGEVVWYAGGRWTEAIGEALVADDTDGEAALETAGAQALAANLVVDAALVDVEVVGGSIHPVRLRERIRAAGPTVRADLGKQARAPQAT